MRVSRRSTSAAVLLVASGLPVSLFAQQPTPTSPGSPLVAQDQPDPYEDRPIREVRLLRVDAKDPAVVVPLPEPGAQLARNQLSTLVGRPYQRRTVTQDITKLSALGRFKTVASDVQMQTDGSVIVTFRVTEQAVIQDVQVVGNRAMSDQEIMTVAGGLPQTAVDRFQIDRVARGIEDLYREKGYYGARVEVDEKELAESSILVYRVVEGERVRVMGVEFVGNTAFTPRELRTAIRTTEYFPVFEKAPLDKEVVLDDVGAIVQFYKDRGYLDARVAHRVLQAPNGKEAIVRFEVDEGPLYTLRTVQVRYETREAVAEYREKHAPDNRTLSYLTPDQMAKLGRRAFSADQIIGLMSLKPGDVYSVNKLEKSKEAIQAAYGKLGNIVDYSLFGGPTSVLITEREVRDDKAPLVDLILLIDEGKPAKVGNIIITGNEKTKQQVIMHQIEVKPERPLDAAALVQSRKNLEDIGLFEPRSPRVSIQPEKPEEPGLRDVLFEVQETNTGAFNFGVAADSDNGLYGSISVTQRNFDILNPPESLAQWLRMDGFRGGGQTASVVIQPGVEYQNYAVSLLEPHFMESDYSTYGTTYFRVRDYDSYDEERYGGRGSIGRKFGRVWDGAVFMRAEWVQVSDLEPWSPVDLYQVARTNFLPGVGVSMARDTTNDRIRPSAGSRVSAGIEQVTGDFTFTRLNADYNVYLNLYESFLGYKTVFRVETSIGYIPQGQNEVPTFERFYLGGRTFRGFETRSVSPVGIRQDTGTLGDDPVGGAFSYFLGTEVYQPLYKDILGAVVFIDTGTVQESFGFDQYRVSVGAGLRVFIPQISPRPLAFDFGFPILKQDTDQTQVFTFSIDIPFQ